MSELKLIHPTKAYEKQVMDYKTEMLENCDRFDGCAGLENVANYDEWLNFDKRLREQYGDDYVPSDVYLAVRIHDNKLIGIMDFRRSLSEFLLNFGGNIGYSVRSSERRKGYGKQMLRLLLSKCREIGENKVLVCCDKENVASSKIIIGNGGVLENEVEDTVGLSNSKIIQRYWISL